jgi:hypothetical protein
MVITILYKKLCFKDYGFGLHKSGIKGISMFITPNIPLIPNYSLIFLL